MTTLTLGRLDKVELRKAWTSESDDFTPWLAREENISLLGGALGIELQVQATEKPVGSFSADIVCASTADNSVVLIENQLERTDHPHLGQILTYAAGLDAVTIVWIAKRFTEEHRAAISWLNRITDERFNFFALEIELWRIGDSPPAPKFNLVASPNNWERIVRRLSGQRGELTPAQSRWMEYWKSLGEFLESEGSALKPPKVTPSFWTQWGLGRTGFNLVALLKFRRGGHVEARVELQGPDRIASFRLLRSEQQEIEDALGFRMEWEENPDAATSMISCGRDADLEDTEVWPEIHQWFLDRLAALDRVFRRRIKVLVAPTGESAEGDDA